MQRVRQSVMSSTITTPKHQHVSEVVDEGVNSGDEEEEEMMTIFEESTANTIEVGDPAGMSIH